MTQAPPRRKFERGSCYGADGIFYPYEEERTVPFSERALRLMFYLYAALCHVFRLEDGAYQAQALDAEGRFSSRELGVSFGRDPETLVRVYGPNGEPAPTFAELERLYQGAWQLAVSEQGRAERERQRAENEQ